MSEPSPSAPKSTPAGGNLHEIAERLRRAPHVDPATQGSLADLIDELAKALAATPVPAEEADRLVKSTAELVGSLHSEQDEGLLGAARARLEEAAVRAENKAPVVTEVVWRLLDALAGFGI